MAFRTGPVESAYGAARGRAASAAGHVGPRLRDAQATVVPVVTDMVAVARDKGAELLESERMGKARQRATDVVRAARGKPVPVARTRRWPRAVAWFAAGGAAGAAIAWLVRQLRGQELEFEAERELPTFGEDGASERETSGNVTVSETREESPAASRVTSGTFPPA